MTVDHIGAIEAQSAAFTEAVSRPGALERKVLACPEWTVGDLVYHLGEVQVFWTLVLREGGALPSDEAAAAAKDYGDDLLGWWRAGSAELVKQLRETNPSAPTWCWWNAERATDAADVAWRQAHEALIHRWDAEQAVGEVRAVDPELAADGVDEFVARYLTGGAWSGPSGVVLLLATDTGQKWRFGCGADSSDAEGGPRQLTGRHDGGSLKPAVIVDGTAEQLDLLLWRRTTATAVGVDGDTALLDAFLSWTSLD